MPTGTVAGIAGAAAGALALAAAVAAFVLWRRRRARVTRMSSKRGLSASGPGGNVGGGDNDSVNPAAGLRRSFSGGGGGGGGGGGSSRGGALAPNMLNPATSERIKRGSSLLSGGGVGGRGVRITSLVNEGDVNVAIASSADAATLRTADRALAAAAAGRRQVQAATRAAFDVADIGRQQNVRRWSKGQDAKTAGGGGGARQA